jgi:hypothetical protein
MKCNNMVCIFNESTPPDKYIYEGICTVYGDRTTPTKAPVNQCVKFLLEGIPEGNPKHILHTLAKKTLTVKEFAEYMRDTVVYNNMSL